MAPSRAIGLSLAVLIAASCGPDEAAPAPETPSFEAAAPAPLPDTGRVYERALVFMSTGPDSVFVVPWLLTTRTGGDTIRRRSRGWLLRGETWDPFYDETWDTPLMRAPWRPLPHDALRLVVGDAGAVEQISYVEPGRRLDLAMDSSLAEWTGRRGESFRFLYGGLVLAERRVPGIVLDMSRAREVDEGPEGDWAVLASGDSLEAVLHAPLRAGSTEPGSWRGWIRMDFRDLPISALTVGWSAVRAFDPARRDVPIEWTLHAADASVEGRLEARSSLLVAGEGDGPFLPVDGFFEVTGTLVIDSARYAVHGLLRHTQGG